MTYQLPGYIGVPPEVGLDRVREAARALGGWLDRHAPDAHYWSSAKNVADVAWLDPAYLVDRLTGFQREFKREFEERTNELLAAVNEAVEIHKQHDKREAKAR